jgi:hypothetical protein
LVLVVLVEGDCIMRMMLLLTVRVTLIY